MVLLTQYMREFLKAMQYKRKKIDLAVRTNSNHSFASYLGHMTLIYQSLGFCLWNWELSCCCCLIACQDDGDNKFNSSAGRIYKIESHKTLSSAVVITAILVVTSFADVRGTITGGILKRGRYWVESCFLLSRPVLCYFFFLKSARVYDSIKMTILWTGINKCPQTLGNIISTFAFTLSMPLKIGQQKANIHSK